MPRPETVIALYRPRRGRGPALRRLVSRHIPALRRLGLATDAPALLLSAEDGTLIEVFQWSSAKAAEQAHGEPEIARIWEAMARIATFPTLKDIREADRHFPHFRPLAVR